MQTQKTVTKQIDSVAQQIAARQASEARLAADIDQAAAQTGHLGYALQLARAQTAPTSEIEALAERLDQAHARLEQLRDRRRSLGLELHNLHEQLTGLHRQRRIVTALGGTPLEVPPAPALPTRDAELTALLEREADLTAKLSAVREAQRAATVQVEASADCVRDLRVKVLTGDASAAQLAKAQTAAEEAQRALGAAAADAEALTSALAVVRTQAETREQALHVAILPALRTAYRDRLAAHVAALREAAVTSEALWEIYPLLATHANVPVAPWPELRLRVDDAKLLAWLLQAAEVLGETD